MCLKRRLTFHFHFIALIGLRRGSGHSPVLQIIRLQLFRRSSLHHLFQPSPRVLPFTACSTFHRMFYASLVCSTSHIPISWQKICSKVAVLRIILSICRLVLIASYVASSRTNENSSRSVPSVINDLGGDVELRILFSKVRCIAANESRSALAAVLGHQVFFQQIESVCFRLRWTWAIFSAVRSRRTFNLRKFQKHSYLLPRKSYRILQDRCSVFDFYTVFSAIFYALASVWSVHFFPTSHGPSAFPHRFLCRHFIRTLTFTPPAQLYSRRLCLPYAVPLERQLSRR